MRKDTQTTFNSPGREWRSDHGVQEGGKRAVYFVFAEITVLLSQSARRTTPASLRWWQRGSRRRRSGPSCAWVSTLGHTSVVEDDVQCSAASFSAEFVAWRLRLRLAVVPSAFLSTSEARYCGTVTGNL